MLLAFAISGCGEDRNGPSSVNRDCGVQGTSNGTVTGAVTASVTGCAYYAVSGTTTMSTAVYLLAGAATAPTHSLTMVREGARPPVGSYTIGTGTTQFTGQFTFNGGNSGNRVFVLTSGTINVTTSTATTLSATLSSLVGTEASA